MDCKEKLHDRQWALVMRHQAGRGTSEHPQTIGLCFFLFWLVVVLMLLLFGFVLFCFVWNFVIWILFAWDLCVLFWGVNVKVFFVF